MSALATSPQRPAGRARLFLAAAVVSLCAVAAYLGSLKAPFVFDDTTAITENPSIRALWPLWGTFSPPPQATTVGGRPLANLTLAFNYAVSGTGVWSYHALNLLIHILAGLALMGVVRRTFTLPTLAARFGRDALPLSLAVSLIWTLHPLQTESVTYVVQRVESLVGLLYLVTLYCFIRAAESPAPLRWRACTVAACLLGMATKEVMVTAPVILLLYDRTFLAGTFAGAWRLRRGLYCCLAATWLLLGFLVASTGWNRGGSAGFSSASPAAYWLTQLEAIAHYLRLSVWPRPLVFDYGTHLARGAAEVAPFALVVFLLVAATAAALRRKPALGFLGAWFLLILAPSSAVPVATQTMAEHRMYLPLAAIAVVAVTGAYSLAGRRSWAPIAATVLALGTLTAMRNEVYRSALTLWGDTAERRPENARAHNNFGMALAKEGRVPEAIAQYEAALKIEPGDQATHSNLGNALARAGRAREAIEQYRAALRIQPDFAPALYNLAKALFETGQYPQAVSEYEAVIRVQPDYADAYNGLGEALESTPGRSAEAIPRYEQALRLNPSLAQAHFNLGAAFFRERRGAEAAAEYEAALRLQPGFAEASDNLGVILCASGRVPEGIQRIEAALSLKPDDAKAHFDLGNALAQSGRIAEAIGQFEDALRIQPDLAEANNNLGMILCRSGRIPEGLQHIEAAIRTKPDFAPAHFVRGLALLQTGRRSEATAEFERVLQLRPGDPSATRMLEMIQSSP